MVALPPPDKIGMANYLEKLAHTLRFQAENDAKRVLDNANVNRHRDKLKDARAVLRARMWQGLDRHRAILQTEQETGIPRDVLEKWANLEAADITRQKRDRAIMQKCATGWTNPQLATHFNVSETHIARIIAKMRATAKRP
ncbi:helix-turn-helix domain-containing protein [Magnetovibrio blakemorei]|nr:hypothetical protein [Magnetovibrio blakemorei]